MKKVKMLISVSAIIFSLMFSACSEAPGNLSYPASPMPESRQTSDSVPVNSAAPDASNKTDLSDDIQQAAPALPQSHFTLEDIAPYSGEPYITVNNNIPYFSEEDFVAQSFTSYSDLDDLKRSGTAYASIGVDIMPTKERDPIGYIKPSGWHTVKYNGLIDGNYLYNRCHLIGYQLCGENDEKNLFTGTRYLNVQGMQPFENMVADYVETTENHVLYRVTPIFQEDNLLASGVLMEAESAEDNGEAVKFCVYVYNVQPGIIIDYSTGESCLASNTPTNTPASGEMTLPVPTAEATADPASQPSAKPAITPAETPGISQEEEPQGTTYILNTNTMRFHIPTCKSVTQIKDKNRQEYTGTRDELISHGYVPCKNCNP